MGYYVEFKYQLEDKLYDIILYMCLIFNEIWILCMYAQFTNCIVYLLWFMYPMLIYLFYAIISVLLKLNEFKTLYYKREIYTRK